MTAISTEAIGSASGPRLDMPHSIEITVSTPYGPEKVLVDLSRRCAVCVAGLLPAHVLCHLCKGRGVIATPTGESILRFVKDFGQ